MGNKASTSSRSSQQSTSSSTSRSYSSTDSRQYSVTDAKAYTVIDDKSYTNIDSRNMSTSIASTDNRSVSQIALDCGITVNDVENYNNNQSINQQQDNSQNLIVSGDGNTLEKISQQLNLTSYGTNIQKCVQDAVNKQQSKNTTATRLSSYDVTSSKQASNNTAKNKTTNKTALKSKNASKQASLSKQENEQKNEQKSDIKQTAGVGSASASGGTDILIIFLILGITCYLLYPELFNNYNINNCSLYSILIAYFLIIYLK